MKILLVTQIMMEFSEHLHLIQILLELLMIEDQSLLIKMQEDMKLSQKKTALGIIYFKHLENQLEFKLNLNLQVVVRVVLLNLKYQQPHKQRYLTNGNFLILITMIGKISVMIPTSRELQLPSFQFQILARLWMEDIGYF